MRTSAEPYHKREPLKWREPFWQRAPSPASAFEIRQGDVREQLQALPAESVHCVVTSPPFWNLRDYRVAGQIGREKTPDDYIRVIVGVFREVWRVLRSDGTLWLELGDSYVCRPGNQDAGGEFRGQINPIHRSAGEKMGPGLKTKDLVGIPWRVALALQEDGWYLRSDIVWARPNPAPESVNDRPTRMHTYVFLLAKSAKYFYDAEAVKEPTTGTSHARTTVNPKAGLERNGTRQNGSYSAATRGLMESRNMRSVWTLATQGNSEAHYATYPIELPERCIMAATSERGCCPICGAPWPRVIRPTGQLVKQQNGTRGMTAEREAAASTVRSWMGKEQYSIQRAGIGWRPGCGHAGVDLLADDLEEIASPLCREPGRVDDSLIVGRKGYARARQGGEGTYTLTRWEQRAYAAQLRNSPYRGEMAAEAGPAFAHYMRKDRAGARPIPGEFLVAWADRGWITKPELPAISPPDPVPCIVLDPFAGLATTGLAALKVGRRFLGIELSKEYVALAHKRVRRVFPLLVGD